MEEESRPAESATLPSEPASPGAAGGDAAPAADKPVPRPRRRPRSTAAVRAFRAGLPLEGTIEKVIKGGYEVRIGPQRAFCPHSQLDLHRVENPEEHLGKTYSFRVLELRRGGEDVILSRRALLEEQRTEEAKSVRATLLEGAMMRGRVARLVDFGAFVDLGAGVTGLVHVSELSYGRVARASEAVEVGDWVWVKILKLDEATGRISLSIRQAQEDPWKDVGSDFEKGRVYPGTVQRLAEFGAFVELRPGIEALAPAREFPPSSGGWRDGLDPGVTREWLVLSVEPERHRLTVMPWPGDGYLLADGAPEPGARLRGKVQRVESSGLRLWLGPGRVAFVPMAWTGVARPADAPRRFPIGSEVPVEVVEAAEGGNLKCGVEGVERVERVERAAAAQKPSKEEKPRKNGGSARRAEKPRRSETAEPASGPSFGTSLGDALRAALEKRDTKA